MMNKTFLKPRLVGLRFSQHAIPLEVMRDWVAFEELIVEVAKFIYLNENRERRRVPRGFSQKFTLRLSAIEEGSAVAVLERYLPDDQHDWEGDYFDQARDRVIDVIQNAEQDNLDSLGFPSEFLGYFDQFGRSLREGERIEFESPRSGTPVKYDLSVRKALVLRQARVYQLSAQLRGRIIQVDAPRRQFTLQLAGGDKIIGSYPKELHGTVVAALNEYETGKVLIMGDIEYDANDKVLKIVQAAQIDLLDPLDVPARIEELALLKDQWLDGRGFAPSREGLSWISNAWSDYFPDDLPSPYVYPTPEGGVQMEWSSGDIECSCLIDLNAKTAALLMVNTRNGESREASVQLDQNAGWEALIRVEKQIVTKA